jgi:succinate-acetate transporter protein
MTAGNTFGVTALSSYGGFWISFGIILTPGGFDIAAQYTNPVDFDYALGLFLFARALIPLLFAQC